MQLPIHVSASSVSVSGLYTGPYTRKWNMFSNSRASKWPAANMSYAALQWWILVEHMRVCNIDNVLYGECGLFWYLCRTWLKLLHMIQAMICKRIWNLLQAIHQVICMFRPIVLLHTPPVLYNFSACLHNVVALSNLPIFHILLLNLFLKTSCCFFSFTKRKKYIRF